MEIIVFTFTGTHLSADTVVNIYYDTDTDQLTAKTNVGGFPRTVYEEYVPEVSDGDLLWTKTDDDFIYEVRWQSFYPFATSTKEDNPSPPVSTMIVTVSKTDQTSPGIDNGTATISVEGGTPPYEYSLDGVIFQESNIFEGLPYGNYTVFVRDGSSEIATKDFTILAAVYPPSPPSPTIKDVIALSDAEIDIQNAYKRVKVLSKFSTVPSIIYNGDFEKWDGFNFLFWTRYGGINISRYQRSVIDSSGNSVPIENYALQFNEAANAGKYLEHDPIPVQIGDTATFSYRVGNTPGTQTVSGIYNPPGTSYNMPATIRIYYISKLRIRCGNYYLYNQDGGNSYQWVNQLAIIAHKVDNDKGTLNDYSVSFKIPECPVTGSLIIELFGFTRIKETFAPEYKITSLITVSQRISIEELSDSVPLQIDDIVLTKESQNRDNDLEGILNISDNLKFYTEKPEAIEIPFGDYYYRPLATDDLSNLYSIFVGNNKSFRWLEYGSLGSRVGFGLALSRSILRAYQFPFKFWQGSLKLREGARDFDYSDIFIFDTPNDDEFSQLSFSVLGCSIDLRTNQIKNIKLAEILEKTLRSTDVSVPSYPNMPDPIFVQDPNADKINGIFTEEFTTEFN